MSEKQLMRQSLGTYEALSENIIFPLSFDFDDELEFHIGNIEKSVEIYGYIDFFMLINNYAFSTVQAAAYAYTRGDSVKDIEETLILPSMPRILETCKQIEAVDLSGKQYFWGSSANKDASYEFQMNKEHVLNVLVLISHFLSFGIDEATIKKIAPKIAPPGVSNIADAVLSHFVEDRVLAADNDYPSDLFQDALFAIYQAPHAEKPALISAYLDNWIKLISANRGGFNILSLGHFISYTHKTRNTLYKDAEGEYPLYIGHWAWEILCLVKLQKIDDSSFRDHEWYPVEIADYR